MKLVLTGSVSIHRTCDATAMKAKNWNMRPFTILHVVLGLWRSMTKFTTYSAYRTSSQVKMAHTHPQMSLTHHKLGSVINQARPSFLHRGPRLMVVTPSSTGPLCRDFSVLTIGPLGSPFSLSLKWITYKKMNQNIFCWKVRILFQSKNNIWSYSLQKTCKFH